MNILLTGATGLLGNNVLRNLVTHGHRVDCLVRSPNLPPALADVDCQPVYADLADPNSLDIDALPDFDVLIHAAALIHIGWTRMEESRRVNVEATRRLAECCWKRGRRLLLVSTVDTLGYADRGQLVSESAPGKPNPPCAYVVSKSEGEACVEAYGRRGLDAVIVHPGFLLGPYDWKPSSGAMLLAVAKGGVPLAPAGGCSAVDVRDVAQGVQQAILRGHRGAHYILAGHNVPYLELWRLMAEVAGRRGPRGRLPNWLASLIGTAADRWGKLRRREPLVNSATVAMGQLDHYYSSELAIRQLGYEVRPLRTTIEDAWQWFNRPRD